MSIRRFTVVFLAEDGGDAGDAMSDDVRRLLEGAGAHVESVSSEDYDGEEVDDDELDDDELDDDDEQGDL